jgi:3D (Asp-Asp-Asp) domain-containing protein
MNSEQRKYRRIKRNKRAKLLKHLCCITFVAMMVISIPESAIALNTDRPIAQIEPKAVSAALTIDEDSAVTVAIIERAVEGHAIAVTSASEAKAKAKAKAKKAAAVKAKAEAEANMKNDTRIVTTKAQAPKTRHIRKPAVTAKAKTNFPRTTKNIRRNSNTPSFIPDGYTVKENFSVTAFAYTGSGITASGKRAQVGRIAVDPSVIPLGTTLYIEGYGICVAADTGGNINGRTVDLYMNSKSACLNWGKRSVKCYILSK